MTSKRRGPLQAVQFVTEDLRAQVDALLKKIKNPGIAQNPVRQQEAYERCLELKNSVIENLEILQNLKKANEPAPVGNYAQRKMDEGRRLTSLSLLLDELAEKLQSGSVGNILKRDKKGPIAAAIEKENAASNDDDEEEEDEETHDSEDEEESEEEQDAAKQFITISDFEAQQDYDLAFKKGEVLTILQQKPDGWWIGQDSRGRKGLVPKTYLEVYKKGKAVLSTADDEEEEEESEEKEEDEEEEEDTDIDETEREGKSSPQTAVKKVALEVNATDVLTSMGTIPKGFRPSTLASLLEEGNKFHLNSYMQPVLSQSNLAFEDLHWDHDHDGVRPSYVRVSLLFTLWNCRMIPVPGSGLQVLSRHVRLCLFDGKKVLSNIHTIRATWLSKSPKTWTFSPRVTGILPSLLDGDCFIRTNSQSPNIGILIELGITYIRNLTGDHGELSCGWAFLQLFDVNGIAVHNRTYEIALHGGTPYEKGIEVDPTFSRRTSLFGQFVTARKQPKLLVKLMSPASNLRDTLNLLPETLVGPKCYIHLLGFYRQLLADVLLKGRIGVQNADLICNPVLATFSNLLEQPDIVDGLRSMWFERERFLKRSEKRDKEFMKQEFVNVYFDSAYPLIHSIILPNSEWANDHVEISRWKYIAEFLQKTREKRSSLYSLLSPENIHQAFDISETTYDFLGISRKMTIND